MHFLQAIKSDLSVLIVCNKTGGTIKGDKKKSSAEQYESYRANGILTVLAVNMTDQKTRAILGRFQQLNNNSKKIVFCSEYN